MSHFRRITGDDYSSNDFVINKAALSGQCAGDGLENRRWGEGHSWTAGLERQRRSRTPSTPASPGPFRTYSFFPHVTTVPRKRNNTNIAQTELKIDGILKILSTRDAKC